MFGFTRLWFNTIEDDSEDLMGSLRNVLKIRHMYKNRVTCTDLSSTTSRQAHPTPRSRIISSSIFSKNDTQADIRQSNNRCFCLAVNKRPFPVLF